jgi:putative hydrolase of the HAD superfamily
VALGGVIEAVLLDALGTLIELRPPGAPLVRGLREDHGIEVTLPEAQRALVTEMAFYRRHNHRAADAARLADLRRQCTEVLRAALPPSAHAIELDVLGDTLLRALRFSPYPDVEGCLTALRARDLRLVVVSNWDISLHQVLTETGLSELVDGAVTSAEVGFAKPQAPIFEAALALAGASPGTALHVGDSASDDVEGARGAGIEAVLLVRSGPPELSGAAPGAMGSSGRVRSIASLAELPALVDGLAA